MYSVIVDGKVLDFKYKKREVDCVFYIGDIIIGTLYKLKNGWACVSIKPFPDVNIFPVYGFKTRYAASAFLLKIQGYWNT